jgi:hypothetical protein
MIASDESASWPLLSAVYHRVRARMPTDQAAQIAIWNMRRGGRLRMRAELREHKARPDPRLASGQKPPPIEPKITPDYPIHPTDVFQEQPEIEPKIKPDYPILPTDVFQEWDWEDSHAIRRDEESRALFEYVNIVVHPDDVLACWPELTEPTAATTTVDPSREWSEVRVALKRPEGVTPRVWAAVQAIDALVREEHVDSAALPQDVLLKRVRGRMPVGSKPNERVPVGKRTMQEALAFRRKRDGTK